MMMRGVKMQTSEERLARTKKEGQTWMGGTDRKRTVIPEAGASMEVIATPADIFGEVKNADN